MKLSKNFKIPLLIILAGVILLGAYIWWPSEMVVDNKSDLSSSVVREQPEQVEIIPTADPKWNLYRNFKYGFQIQYPAEWKFIKIYKNREETDFTFSDIGEDSRINLFIIKNTNLNPILEDLRSQKRYVKDIKVLIGSREMIKIFSRNPYLDYDSYGYLFEYSGSVYKLSGGGPSLYSWYIDRMVETFEIF